MATAQEITIDNYDTLLKESTQGRAGTPDGNIYFDTANDLVEIITREELASVNLGSGLEDNPLTNYFGITGQAFYAFVTKRRAENTALRKFKKGVDGKYKQAGAFAFVNGTKLSTNGSIDDRKKVRGTGFIEYAGTGNGSTDVDRIYFCPKSVNDIDATAQPYSMLPASLSEGDRQAATPVNFVRTGPVNEVVQVYGDTSFGDSGAGNFDYRLRPLLLDVRKFGRNFGEVNSFATGIAELAGFATGFGLGDSPNDTNIFNYDDIITTPVAPFSGMSYESYPTPQTKTGFTDGAANFSAVIHNANGGSIYEVLAFLDAIMTLDADRDIGAGTYRPKRGAPLYSRNNDGKFVTKAGVYLENISTAEQGLIIQTDDDGDGHTYPFFPTVRVFVSDAFANDPNGWAQAFYSDGAGALDFDTSNAVILNDANGDQVVFSSADVLGVSGAYYLEFSYDYDSNTQAGLSAGSDKDIVFLAEGDGVAKAAIGSTTITRTTLITLSVLSEIDTNF
jgi:hypothetical protein